MIALDLTGASMVSPVLVLRGAVAKASTMTPVLALRGAAARGDP